jgi:hypothetical protein
MCHLQKLRRTEVTGSLEPNTGQSSVKPEGELCAKIRPSNFKKICLFAWLGLIIKYQT